MKKVVIAGLLGGLVYFIFGALSWMVLPWHNATVKTLAREGEVMDFMRQNETESGVFFFPDWPKNNKDPNACAAYAEKHKMGPLGFLVYHAEGQEMKMAPSMIGGFILNFITALLIAKLLARSPHRSYACRVGFVSCVGWIAALTTHGAYWNWMMFPCDYSLAMVADVVIGWTLAGLLIAAIVKPAGSTDATIPGVVEPG